MPQVASVTYVSKEKALEDFEKRQPDVREPDRLPPQQPAAGILRDRPAEPLGRHAATFLRTQPAVDFVQDIKQTVNQIITVIGVLRTGGIVVLLIVGLTVLFIIVNTIRLAVVARAEEIEIMRLVGASDAFIRWPFVFEGALVGLFGAAITLGLLYMVQAPLTSTMSDFFNVLPVQASTIVGQNVVAIVLATGIGIGVLGPTCRFAAT